MTSQRFLASVLLLGAGVSAQPQGNNQFKVVDQATITCSTAGFKCGYNDFDYETVDITGSGQSSIGGLDDNNNMIWSPLDVATDQLILSNCQSDNCLLASHRMGNKIFVKRNQTHLTSFLLNLLGLQRRLRLRR